MAVFAVSFVINGLLFVMKDFNHSIRHAISFIKGETLICGFVI